MRLHLLNGGWTLVTLVPDKGTRPDGVSLTDASPTAPQTLHPKSEALDAKLQTRNPIRETRNPPTVNPKP